MKIKCLFLFSLLFCLSLLRPIILCELAQKDINKKSDKSININKSYLESIKKFVNDSYIVSNNINKDCSKKNKSLFKKNVIYTIDNLYIKNKNNGAYDYTFPNISKKITKSVFDEYLNCRVFTRRVQTRRVSTRRVQATGVKKQDLKNKFDWCACRKARASTRLYLVTHIINELANRDKNKELVYVSFGSGKLLQDYLIIKGLVAAGFKNINVNLIDLGYANTSNISINNGIDVEDFLRTFCRKKGESYDEKDSLCAFCKLAKSCNCIKKINSYTTYFDFLKTWGKNRVDVLLLIDPMKLFAELLETKDPVYVNHVCVSSCKNKACEVVFLLPYVGRPKIFYKNINGDLNISSFSFEKCKKDRLFSCINSYKGYVDRANFIRSLDLCLNWPSIWPSNSCCLLENKKVNISMSQSQRYSFYDIIKSTVSDNALIYQLDDNKIFFGKCNLLKDAYKKEGYKVLK